MIDFYPHTVPCDRCEATAWECVGTLTSHKGRTHDVVECCFCGNLRRVDAVARPPAVTPRADRGEFRFAFGRFSGLTIAEADAQPNGRRYLEVLRDTNAKLRDRIEEYLATVREAA